MASLPNSSSIPGALAAFMTIASGALPAGSTVWFGEELPTYQAPITFQITEIMGDQQPAEIGKLYRREETFSLICSLFVYQGGTPDFPSLLQAVMNNFALISSAVGNDPTLAGSVRYAQVGNFAITPATDANGKSSVNLDFQLRCAQRVNSLSS